VPALLVAALVIVPIVEIWVLLQVGQLLGVLQTVVLLVVMSLLGAYLLRREGARTWQAFRTAPRQRTAAGRGGRRRRARHPRRRAAAHAGLRHGRVRPAVRPAADAGRPAAAAHPPGGPRLSVGAVLGGARGPSSRRRPSATVVDGEVVRPPDDPGRSSGPLPPS
jgi:hypothetical protein